MNDEFYLGWENKAPVAVGKLVRRTVVLGLLALLLLGVLLAAAQRTMGRSVFEWGTTKSFTGILERQPYPHLLVERPGTQNGQEHFSSYYLVNPFKFGMAAELAARLDGKAVTLRGTLIYREDQTMIEVVPGSLKADATQNSAAVPYAPLPPVSLGEQTLRGEIVDSKCFLGVMNPGQLTPHRACAIRCISGGIPPVLVVRQSDGTAHYLLLVSRTGRPVNQEVLNFVAEPVQITGEVLRQGGLLILRADPASYRRIDSRP